MTAELCASRPRRRALLALRAGKTPALLGPGFGLDDARHSALACASSRCELPLPCVLDADALTALAYRPARPPARRGAPACAHASPRRSRPPAAAARAPRCKRDRYAAARELALRCSGQVVVLKGARTVVASPAGALRVCGRGHTGAGRRGHGRRARGTDRRPAVPRALRSRPPMRGSMLHALAAELAAAATAARSPVRWLSFSPRRCAVSRAHPRRTCLTGSAERRFRDREHAKSIAFRPWHSPREV